MSQKANNSKNENQLKLLYAKRDMLFSRVQSIRDQSLQTSDLAIREAFLCSIENLDSLRADFESLIHNINVLELELDPNHTVSYQTLSSFDDLYCRIKRTARGLEKPPAAASNLTRDRPKLAPIQIPEFNGDIRNWSLFIDSFENTINKNASLTDHERLYYLAEKLTGKAKAACAGITFSAENYNLILDTLKAKYEDKRLVATAYLDQLFDLKVITACNENNLEKFIETFASAVRAVRNLKVDDLCDFLFLYIGLKKLDSETVRLFETHHRGMKMPKFADLECFVRDHIKILQRTSFKHEATKKVVSSERKMDASSKSLKSTHTYVNTAPAPVKSSVCSLCSSHHPQLYRCPGFLKLAPIERYEFARANNLCYNCLSDRHRVVSCNSSTGCRTCSARHHTLLHFENNNAASNVSRVGLLNSGSSARSATERVRPANDVTLCSLSASTALTTVVLATARVVIVDLLGEPHIVRALLDGASQSNFITQDCCQRLGFNFNKLPSRSVVKGFGGLQTAIHGSVKTKFGSRFNNNIWFDIDSLVTDKITEQLPTVPVDTSLLTKFKDLPLADDTYAVPGVVDLLIGASIVPHLQLSRKIQGSPTYPAPHALETVLGFVIMGAAAPAFIDRYSTVSHCCTVEPPPLESTVRKFWEIEEVNVPPILSPDDKMAEEIYCRTTTRDENGRYVVALPFKGDIFSLGDSRASAEKRFRCLERKMQASPQLKQAYDEVVNEYLDKGYISPAPADTDETQPSYIIPHHGVIREDKLTTKLRVVLDGSAKTSTSVSLNDILYCGQNLQGNLFNIIVNFRLFAVALSADIRQMFLCLGVRECDRRFQRFLYRFSPHEPLKVYEFNRVCFGLKSSPFHALRTVKQLVADEGDAYPKARATLETGLYMDDFVYSIDSHSEAIETASQVISLMKAGPDLLMSILRQKYWILSARSLIRARVHKCVPCFKLRPRFVAPEMADHRSCRVVQTVKPFVHSGTDFAGPFKVTISRGRGIRATKAYVCLFICMTTRAVHIELASDLSTQSFMSAFKRFLSRRGPVKRMYSDNGTNYVGARRNISELHAFLRSKYYQTEFAHVLAENRIEWYFNTPAASHFGGNWEANIKSLKSHLFRVIGEQILSFEELSTVLAQVEAVMNTRPLCRTLSSDPSEPLALTPAHFLNTTPLKYLPSIDVDDDRLHLLTRHALLDRLVQSFWRRWRTDYLHTLQSRQKWNTPSNPITVGTVVVLMTENAPPLHWPLGLVEEVFPDALGVTRIVRVKTATGSYLRPVVRLCPLPNQQ